jgi:hypothetical protein
MNEYSFEYLKEKHKDVIENPAVQAIVNWRDPLYNPDPYFSEEKYVRKALKNLKHLIKKDPLKNI